MKKKENQRITLTKQLLKNSLMELLETETIHKISIKTLCEQAGINRSTFYKYYGSQYDLLKEIEQDTVQNIIAILENKADKKADALCEICNYLDKNALYVRPLINNSNESEFIHMILSHPTIQREVQKNTETVYDSIHLNYIFDFITFGCARIVQVWINKKERESGEEIATLLSTLMKLS